MTAGSLVLCFFVLLLACDRVLQARIFYRREEGWRERERQLVDRLLRKANVEPLEVQRAKVLQVDDNPEPNKSPIDLAWEMDVIKEELEQLHPDVSWMTLDQAQAVYPQEWREIQAKLESKRQPLRVNGSVSDRV